MPTPTPSLSPELRAGLRALLVRYARKKRGGAEGQGHFAFKETLPEAPRENCGTGKGGFQAGNTCAAGSEKPFRLEAGKAGPKEKQGSLLAKDPGGPGKAEGRKPAPRPSPPRPTLPTLKGSEKQVSWANEIRARLTGGIANRLEAIDRALADARAGRPGQDRLGRPLPPATPPTHADETRAALGRAAEAVAREVSASRWIDRRYREDGWGLVLDAVDVEVGPDPDAQDEMSDRISDFLHDLRA